MRLSLFQVQPATSDEAKLDDNFVSSNRHMKLKWHGCFV